MTYFMTFQCDVVILRLIFRSLKLFPVAAAFCSLDRCLARHNMQSLRDLVTAPLLLSTASASASARLPRRRPHWGWPPPSFPSLIQTYSSQLIPSVSSLIFSPSNSPTTLPRRFLLPVSIGDFFFFSGFLHTPSKSRLINSLRLTASSALCFQFAPNFWSAFTSIDISHTIW